MRQNLFTVHEPPIWVFGEPSEANINQWSHLEFDLGHTIKEPLIRSDQAFFVDQVCCASLNIEIVDLGFIASHFSQLHATKGGNF